MIDAGIFLTLTFISVGCFLIGAKFGSLMGSTFIMLSVIIFFILSLMTMSGESIGYEVSTTDGVTTTVATHYIMGNGAEFNEQMQWVGWIFLIIALTVSSMFLISVIGRGY